MNTEVAGTETSTLISLVRQVCVDLPTSLEITGESRFIEDIGMESVNRLMLMTLVEQEFGISLEQHMPALVELQTVRETARFISDLKAAA